MICVRCRAWTVEREGAVVWLQNLNIETTRRMRQRSGHYLHAALLMTWLPDGRGWQKECADQNGALMLFVALCKDCRQRHVFFAVVEDLRAWQTMDGYWEEAMMLHVVGAAHVRRVRVELAMSWRGPMARV